MWPQLTQNLKSENFILLRGAAEDFIFGWNFTDEIKIRENKLDFELVDSFLKKYKGHFIFGCLSYDIKNSIESSLKSENTDDIQFPLIHFFVTEHLVEFRNNELKFYGTDTENAFKKLIVPASKPFDEVSASVSLFESTSKEKYIQNVNKIKSEIQFGNIYEMNYCVQFKAKSKIDSLLTFIKLDELAQAPFSVYLNTKDHAVICASPERFLKKENDKLISQPIKGTAKRSENLAEDDSIKNNLQQNQKERSENIMIVDLVRNDLSKIAAKNSVHVDELCGVYTFKTVHQLISTVSCHLKPTTTFTDILKATFPMGSMTGAPKIAAMRIAEQVEDFKRGIYSGSIGYIKPNGDFDFNVVIRSILYNKQNNQVSCSVGSAITIQSEPEKEYEECLLKLQALKKALC